MADTPFTGLTASVSIGSTPDVLCYISGVDLTLEREIIEIIAFGADYKEKVPAIKNWSASVDGTAAFANNNSQETLYKAFDEDTLLDVKIALDDNTYFTGKAYVENLNISIAADDKASLTCDFAGSGAQVFTIPTTPVTP